MSCKTMPTCEVSLFSISQSDSRSELQSRTETTGDMEDWVNLTPEFVIPNLTPELNKRT